MNTYREGTFANKGYRNLLGGYTSEVPSLTVTTSLPRGSFANGLGNSGLGRRGHSGKAEWRKVERPTQAHSQPANREGFLHEEASSLDKSA
jgi:hypothetical protein